MLKHYYMYIASPIDSQSKNSKTILTDSQNALEELK